MFILILFMSSLELPPVVTIFVSHNLSHPLATAPKTGTPITEPTSVTTDTTTATILTTINPTEAIHLKKVLISPPPL